MEKLLLHCCCGPCSTSSIERLKEMGYSVVLFFGNSNIFPPPEREKRLAALRQVGSHFDLEVITTPYNHERWLRVVKGHEGAKEGGSRCQICFEYNLKEAAEEAQKRGIPYFTTTLTVSPHKRSPLIFKVGENFEEFVPVDFKKKGGFQRSIELAKHLELYRQDYCGCEFSKLEREAKGP
ncbi:MAG: epoxyqueuosine reductase QueH [Spirochaetales bacterium]|nr:epoxyqueuosine reductase QueH [Spirochaetales bacterium]